MWSPVSGYGVHGKTFASYGAGAVTRFSHGSVYGYGTVESLCMKFRL